MRFSLAAFALLGAAASAQEPAMLRYNNPGLVVDLGVGLWAWPLPMDYDGDGDLDLVVFSGGKPYHGLYFFENPGGGKTPVFKPARRIGDGAGNPQLSPGGEVMTPGRRYPDFLRTGFANPVDLPLKSEDFLRTDGRVRANQWKLVDYDGDGRLDLVVGLGVWTDYGWDDAWDSEGRWKNGPLHGWVYWARNTGANEAPAYSAPEQVLAGGQPVDVFGMPSPNFADFDGDGDLDLLCGEFLDGFTYFENAGTRTEPRYLPGRRLENEGRPLAMDLQMITPVSIDWDGDGDPDLIVGDEDGRVAFVENLGGARFAPPVYFRQEADLVKFGALATPVGFDWDGDGDEDLIVGDTAGHIAFLENLDGGDPPRWAAPRPLEAGGERIRILAGPNGSIQGPAEAKWGYTTQTVGDWDGDGLPDLIVNSIWGKVVWYRNVGSRRRPSLAAAQPVRTVEPRSPAWTWWKPGREEFVTQWRTTPFAIDWNRDGRMDLVMLDHEGYLAWFERGPDGRLLTGRRIFHGAGPSKFDQRHAPVDAAPGPLQLNAGWAGKSGRRKLAFADWDGDGRPDLLVNSVNISLLKNLGGDSETVTFADEGPLAAIQLAGHDTSPTTVDWDGDGVRDLVIGSEDGFFYYLRNDLRKAREAR